MASLAAVIDRLTRMAAIGAAISILMMALSTTVDVGLRYFGHRPIPGVVELNELLMASTVFLALAYTQYRKRHVAALVLVSRLSPRVQRNLEAVVLVVPLVVFLVITWRGASAAYESIIIGEYRFGLIRFPLWPSKIVVPIGGFLLCLQLLLVIVRGLLPAEAETPQHETIVPTRKDSCRGTK